MQFSHVASQREHYPQGNPFLGGLPPPLRRRCTAGSTIDELGGTIDGRWEAIASHLANDPSPDRMQYLIRPIALPVDAPSTEIGTDITATGSQSPGA
ncbi:MULTISPECIES: hypothetical protein [unclassified Streptomyces]|uniref:hypothetical protein n=1 Tax=unclassified Streptomyces TaxID=2593676 RepID=UPI0037F83851